MRVERVTVGFGCTLNLGNFNSARFDVQFEARLEEGEDALAAVHELHEQAVAEVKRQAAARKSREREGWDGGY